MKKTVAILLLALISSSAFADVCVSGYFRKDGTYVDGYCRTSPNSSKSDNYGSEGNYNPYTGKTGHQNQF